MQASPDQCIFNNIFACWLTQRECKHAQIISPGSYSSTYISFPITGTAHSRPNMPIAQLQNSGVCHPHKARHPSRHHWPHQDHHLCSHLEKQLSRCASLVRYYWWRHSSECSRHSQFEPKFKQRCALLIQVPYKAWSDLLLRSDSTHLSSVYRTLLSASQSTIEEAE